MATEQYSQRKHMENLEQKLLDVEREFCDLKNKAKYTNSIESAQMNMLKERSNLLRDLISGETVSHKKLGE